MIFADYQELVLQEYKRKRAAGELSHRMIRLTCAKFKAECEAVCDRRYDRKDERVLEEFFGAGGDKVASLRAIKQCHPDKFRPLVNFLKGKTVWPDEKNIELLAWLINFKPRPQEFGTNYESGSRDVSPVEQDESAKGKDEKVGKIGSAEKTSPDGEKKITVPGTSVGWIPVFRKRKIIMTALILAVVVSGIYWAWPKSSNADMKGPDGCMYWLGDHYQPVSCSEKHGDTPVIALDSGKLVRFREITRPDTITENALGSVWYAKFRGVYECYTSPGYHPIDTSLKLKLLKDYVLINHIRSNQDSERPRK